MRLAGTMAKSHAMGIHAMQNGRKTAWLIVLAAWLLLRGASLAWADDTLPQQATALLRAACLKCHNGQMRAGGRSFTGN